MPSTVWELHDAPHRHYKVSVDGKKPTWNGAAKQRIASVTQVLQGADNLAGWAASQATAACERVMVDWYGLAPAMQHSLLTVGELAALQPEWPDNVRDAKGDSGTALHGYLHYRLAGHMADGDWPGPRELPYGLRVAADAFLGRYQPRAVCDIGPRVERAVGDHERAIAGTYDAQVDMWCGDEAAPQRRDPDHRTRHRLDYKQSNTVQPTMFAQLAAYEDLAVRCCGEEPSQFLSIVHFSPLGTFDLHSIAVGSIVHQRARLLFDAYLAIHRTTPQLARLLKEPA